jgi:sugar/nucleoside kinase (ribokinase family)
MASRYDLVGIAKVNYDIFESPKGRETFVGGHVSNIVSCAQLIGLKTALIARIGRDEAGDACIAAFKRIGIDVSHLHIDNDPTPTVTINLIENDRKITALPAKLTTYVREDLDLIRKAKAVFIDTKTLNLEACMKDCISAKVIVVSSLQHLGDPFNDGVKLLETYPPDILFANEEEAEKSKTLVNAVLSKGGTVITTLGSAGCQVERKDHKQRYGAFKAKVVDATGAGDAFAAGYLFGFVRGLTEQRCAQIANAMGAIAVSQHGPVPSVTWREVEKFLAGNDSNL